MVLDGLVVYDDNGLVLDVIVDGVGVTVDSCKVVVTWLFV